MAEIGGKRQDMAVDTAAVGGDRLLERPDGKTMAKVVEPRSGCVVSVEDANRLSARVSRARGGPLRSENRVIEVEHPVPADPVFRVDRLKRDLVVRSVVAEVGVADAGDVAGGDWGQHGALIDTSTA